ncbi:MAG: helix-turn-helix transcriptional regulator [Treponema sp.]|nr:helix-turn-helix transcriptional regulator [Candidatus Treponema caballi]
MDIVGFTRRVGIHSQTELAEKLGVTPQNVTRYYGKKKPPSYEMCRKLIQIGITLEELFDKETEQAYEAHRASAPDDMKDELIKSIDFNDPVIQQVLGRILSEKLVIGLK